jgi:hypothetical protein
VDNPEHSASGSATLPHRGTQPRAGALEGARAGTLEGAWVGALGGAWVGALEGAWIGAGGSGIEPVNAAAA